MAYLGNQVKAGSYRKLTDISGSFNGTTKTFTTSVPPGSSSYYVTAGSASQLLVSLNNVIQEPEVDYTVSTNSITFTVAPAAGVSFFGVLMGDALNVGTPSSGSVGTSQLAGNLSVGLAGGSAASPSLYFTGNSNNGIYSPATDTLAITTASSERARIDASGRFLVGTTSAGSTLTKTIEIHNAGTGVSQPSYLVFSFPGANALNCGYLQLFKSRGATVGTNTIVANGDRLGMMRFNGANGTGYDIAAEIYAEVDGVPGASIDMPGRLVFATTSDGASTTTEAFRITNDRVHCYNQAAPVAVDATATLTVGNLKNGIITSSTALAVTMTLPTGTLTEGGFSGAYNNMTFEWSVINTGATNAVTVQAGTDHTLVGSGTVAAGNSGKFATRRTAANTWVSYRLSS